MFVNVWITCLEPNSDQACILTIGNNTSAITSTYLQKALRAVCTISGGKHTFRFTASEIGTRSIRSGAAMSLFLANHSVAKIMILGR